MNQHLVSSGLCPSLKHMAMVVIVRRLWESNKTTTKKKKYKQPNDRFLDKKNAIIRCIEQLPCPPPIKADLKDLLVLVTDHVIERANHLRKIFHCEFDFTYLPLNVYGVIDIPALVRYFATNNCWPNFIRGAVCSCSTVRGDPPSDSHLRFHMSAVYCVEDVIPNTWAGLSESTKNSYLKGNISHSFAGSTSFVPHWIGTVNQTDLSDLVAKDMKTDLLSTGNIDGLKYMCRLPYQTQHAIVFTCFGEIKKRGRYNVNSEHHISTALFLLCDMISQADYDGELISLEVAPSLWWGLLGRPSLQSDQVFALFESALILSSGVDRDLVAVFKVRLEDFFAYLGQQAEIDHQEGPNTDLFEKVISVIDGVLQIK